MTTKPTVAPEHPAWIQVRCRICGKTAECYTDDPAKESKRLSITDAAFAVASMVAEHMKTEHGYAGDV